MKITSRYKIIIDIVIYIILLTTLLFSVSSLSTIIVDDNIDSTLSQRLDNAMKSAYPEDKFNVIFWFEDTSAIEIDWEIQNQIKEAKIETNILQSQDISIDKIHELRALKTQIISDIYEKNNQIIANEKFHANELIYVSKYAPVILATLSASRIEEISKSSSIDSVDLYFGNNMIPCGSPEDEISYAHIPEVHSSGYYGSNVKIGIVDVFIPTSEQVEFYLTEGLTYHIDSQGVTGEDTSHVISCANVITTIAPDAEIYFTARSDAFIALEWLVEQNVDIISMSLSGGDDSLRNSYTAMSRWIDHISYQHNITICLPTGKYAEVPGPTSGVGAINGIREMQMAYNAITVGAMLFNPSTENPEEEIISPSSSFSTNQSPTVPFKPDICAPYGDSSRAVALTAGIIALMIDARPNLAHYPDAIKAIISAAVNPDSPHRYLPKNRTVYLTNPSYTQYGAGLIDASNALRVIRSLQYDSHYINETSLTWTRLLGVDSTEPIRISLAFMIPADTSSNSHTALGSINSHPIPDLDLYIYDEDGNICYDYSCRVGTNVEIVEFTPPSSGIYTIKIFQETPSDATVYFTVAWE